MIKMHCKVNVTFLHEQSLQKKKTLCVTLIKLKTKED